MGVPITSTRIITSLLIILSFLASSSAMIQVSAGDDFLFFCDYGTKVFSFNVTNSFEYPVALTVSKSGSITQFADVQFLAENSIGPFVDLWLDAGETVLVSAILTLNREVDYGERELLVTLDWGSSITKSFKVVVSNCHSALLEADSLRKYTCLLSLVENIFNRR